MSEYAVILHIHGAIQGIGFRPFIHRLAQELDITGYVQNTASGVTVLAEGNAETVEAFVEQLPERAPALAVIEQISVEACVPSGEYSEFAIRPSAPGIQKDTLVLPDLAICPACSAELKNPADRRFGYPFINCTNCGPRFTIIKEVPYDRATTTMASFTMCRPCAQEYHDLDSRRYHAQPDCCDVCGPKLSWIGTAGENGKNEPLEQAAESLRAGNIVAVKSIGGFHLACDAENAEAVRRLRQRKHRDERPFAMMCADLDAVREVCELSSAEEKLLSGPRAPILLLTKKNPTDYEYISDNAELGVMLPYTPLHLLLFEKGFRFLVMTSGNLSHQPIVYRNEDALQQLGGIADGFLLHNREIAAPCDDSLCRLLEGKEYFLRRSRGYAPQPVSVSKTMGMLLACGAEQKASFAFSKGNHVFLSQHMGDLKNWETLENYRAQLNRFQSLFGIQPHALACDLHPDYLSTEYAQEQSSEKRLPLVRVQHHHAHMASCMLDNNLEGPAIGLIWDGTGYGTDGTIWGGECLVGGYKHVERFGSLRAIPLIGGDKAITDVRRLAFVLLREAGEAVDAFPEALLWENLLLNQVNCPVSTGMGRLFDGVAALLGITEQSSYEGQAAIALENAAVAFGPCSHSYPIAFSGKVGDELLRFDWRPMIRSIMADKRKGMTAGEMASAFLNTLVRAAVVQCSEAAGVSGIRDVVLSGGTFQNRTLMQHLPKALREAGLKVYYHRRFATNDEGIAAGQLAVAAARLSKEMKISGSCSGPGKG